jgi:signal transduction histidine kinase
MTADGADLGFDQVGGGRLGRMASLLARSPRLARLQTKLIVPYVVLTVLTALGGLFVVTRLVTSSVRERFVNQLFEASRVAADGIVRRERSHLENLRLMAYTEGVRDAVASRDPQALQDLLWPIVLNNSIDVVSIVGGDGVEILSLARDPQTGQYVGSQRMMDFSGVSLVVDVLAGQSDDRGDKFAGFLQTTYGAYLFTSAPIETESGEVLGAILTGTSLETLLSDLKTQSLADIVVLDSNGTLVSTSLVQPEEGYATVELSPGEVDGIGPSLTKEVTLYSRPYQIVYAPLVVRQQGMGVLGVLLPSNYIVSTEATSRNTFSLLFSLTTVGVIVVGYVLSQSIARPILRLRAMSQAVASGDLGQQTGIEAGDEIGELASAFDTMTLHLRERTEEAARLYAETVQRNKELAEINRRLQTTQQQLIQSEKLASVGQLTAGIVHDVKNPLAVIKGIAEELRDEPGLDPAIKEQMTVVRDNASRAATIVGDLLKFARQAKPEMRQSDMRESVEAAVRLTEYLARKGNVQVVKDVPARAVTAYYDNGQIEQVLINLIQNAIQAMPAGGTLRINLSQAAGALAVAVEDTGVGIPAEDLGRIFDPFFTTKKEGEGTGLGLSVSYGIISRHGGKIGVESAVGKGTTFTILLPVGERPPSPG